MSKARGDFLAHRQLHCVKRHAVVFSTLNYTANPASSRTVKDAVCFPDASKLLRPASMSASAAKASKKELNSNHDGADETSGEGNGGLPFSAIFTFFFNIGLVFTLCLLVAVGVSFFFLLRF